MIRGRERASEGCVGGGRVGWEKRYRGCGELKRIKESKTFVSFS